MFQVFTNIKMNKLLQEIKKFPNDQALDTKLSNILEKGFVREYGCIFFRDIFFKSKTRISEFPDKTGYECFVNKIHLEDHLSSIKQTKNWKIYQAVSMALETAKRLSCYDIDGQYRCILSINLEDSNEDFHSFIFRFHQIRPLETWSEKDLEVYEEAVLLIDTPKNCNLAYEKRKNSLLADLLNDPTLLKLGHATLKS